MNDRELAAAVGGELIGEGLIRISATVSLQESVGHTPLAGLNGTLVLPGETQGLPAIYIDTETTGLSGGSGTLAFLVGVAVVSEGAVRLTQLLMTRFAAESALLGELARILPDSHRLVSYNGKSYDLPLLVTRYRMQGWQPDLAQRVHLDLLHPVRRLFGKRWGDCRLSTAERNLLGFRRTNDLPGSEAPEAWFAYLRAGYAEQLIKVVAHNRQDILSLAALHHAVAEAIAEPARYGVDLHALARWWSENEESKAIALLRAHDAELCDDGKRLMAQLLRRQGQWAEAAALWEALAARGCVESIERLAKYHEHVSKDLTAALRYCEQLPGSHADRHRRQRLLEKIEKKQPGLLALSA
jgi:hypothetical protein